MSSLSQAEIDALLKGEPADASANTGELDLSAFGLNNDAATNNGTDEDSFAQGEVEDISTSFDPNEVDALGELANICMGTSATTMYALLGRKVTITTPKVALCRTENVLSSYKRPFIAINVEFVEGIIGNNLLILKDYDAALITDLLMGGEGDFDKDNIELNEIHMSAMSEVMNQMMGSAATAMSNMMGGSVNISPPQVSRMEVDETIGKFFGNEPLVLKISFDMEIEGLLKSKLLQVMTIAVAKELLNTLMNPAPTERSKPAPAAPAPKATAPAPAPAPYPMPMGGAAPAAAKQDRQSVKAVKPMNYESFDEAPSAAQSYSQGNGNLELINDIPLQVTVELGKTKKNLNDVVNFGIGSIIVLDKLAGELVDVIVNGKKIAKGEVVVIDENYGVRITEILRTPGAQQAQ